MNDHREPVSVGVTRPGGVSARRYGSQQSHEEGRQRPGPPEGPMTDVSGL